MHRLSGHEGILRHGDDGVAIYIIYVGHVDVGHVDVGDAGIRNIDLPDVCG
jgi:hypothetical protein